MLKKLRSVHPQRFTLPTPISVMSKDQSEIMDLEDRDPNNLSQHLQVSWDEIIGEPMSIRSPECAWTTSHHCYRLSKNCCYICLSVICAPLTAFCLGITFACLSFEQIWCTNPCLRVWKISCAATRNFVTAFAAAIVIPFTSACGYVFSQIKIKSQTLNEVEKKEQDVLLI